MDALKLLQEQLPEWDGDMVSHNDWCELCSGTCKGGCDGGCLGCTGGPGGY